MPDLTIFTINSDLQLLNAILNGVAMVCQQTSFIWGFAFLVSMWRLLSTATGGTLASLGGSGGGAVLANGFMGALMPMVFAMLLTTSGFQSKVQVESSSNGQVKVVDNVPFVIAVIPAAGSLISKEIGTIVETAFQGVGTDYASISASGNGFINPLKVLLTSRSAIMRLGSISSEVRTLLSSCVATDSGADYASIQRKVLNARNTGASEQETIEVAGVKGTAIGALLFEASKNQVGLVPDIVTDSQSIVSCNSAAYIVAQHITDTLESAEFSRVVQGAVNGMDQPISSTDFSFSRFAQNYTAVRTADRSLATLVQGTTQTNAEALNLLFSEMVNNSLKCLANDYSTRTACQAAVIQSNEVERNNIQAAAAEVPMLKYAGSFANYLLALVIGLGPVIVLFMMFAGVGAGKSITAIAHIMVWPLLCMNVGAELINGMIYMSVAKFLASLSQGGFLSQAVTYEAYKEFSLQIGTASHLMASLPVIMSTIFAFTAAKSLASAQQGLTPKSQDTAEAVTPKVLSSSPMVQQSSMYRAEQGIGFATGGQTGAMETVASSGQFAAANSKTSNTLSSAFQRQQILSEGQSNLAAWKVAANTGVFNGHRIGKNLQNSLRTAFSEDKSTSEVFASGASVTGNATNTNSAATSNATTATVGGGVNIGGGGGGGARGQGGGGGGSFLPFSFQAGLSNATTLDVGTSANNSLVKSNQTDHKKQEEESARLSKVLDAAKSTNTSDDSGKQLSKDIAKSKETQAAFHKTITESKSSNDVATDAVEQSSSFVGLSAKIGGAEMAQAYNTVPEFRAFQLGKGAEMEKFAASAPYMAQSRQFVESNAGRDILGSPGAKEAAIRHDAMVRMASDPGAAPSDKLKAVNYLNAEGYAMRGIGQSLRDTSLKDYNIPEPTDKTSVESPELKGFVNGRAPTLPDQPKPVVPRPAGQKARPRAPTFTPRFTPTPEATMEGQFNSRTRALNVRPDVNEGEARADQAGLNSDGAARRNRQNVVQNLGSPYDGNPTSRTSAPPRR